MAPHVTAGSRIVASKDQVSATLSGEAVILGMLDGVYYGLDPVATRIWALVQVPRTLDEVATMLEAEFDVSHDRALADLLALAASLAERGLVEVLPVPPAA